MISNTLRQLVSSRLLLGVAAVGWLSTIGCSSDPGLVPNTPKAKVVHNADGTVNDQGRCEWKGRADREASEIAGPGSVQPNVRRVYAIVGTGDDRHKVLVCREIDTNLDGIKDVFRWYNEKGEALREEADSNYDGKIDTWITFSKGRLAEVRIDHRNTGNPDEWRYYSAGKLSRVKRDTNGDGKPDVWEIYRDDRLERMGVDVDGDEHVDRWDHDTELRKKIEAEENKKQEAANDAAKKKADKEHGDADAANQASGSDAPPATTAKPKPKRTTSQKQALPQ